MPDRITLDREFAMASALGGSAGLKRSHLRGELGAFTAVHADLDDAADQGLLPHLDPTTWARSTRRWHRHSKAWRKNVDTLLVVGEPSSTRAASMLLEMATDRPSDAPQIVFLDTLDATQVHLALESGKRKHLVVLDGPPWVRLLAEALQPKVEGTTVFYDEDGSLPAPWSGEVELLATPAACDPRFGAVGPVALALCNAAGLPLPPIVEALEVMEARIRRPGLHDNPAYQLASWIVAAQDQLRLDEVVLLIPTPRLRPWAEWTSRAWAATTSKTESQTGLRQYHGLMPQVVQAGDEAAVQRLIEGPSNLVTLALWVEQPGTDLVLNPTTSAWSLNKEVMGTHIQQLVRSGRPVIRGRLPELTVPVVAGLTALFLQTALAIAARLEIDPLSMPAADAWRLLQSGQAPE